MSSILRLAEGCEGFALGGADHRYFHNAAQLRLGQLGRQLDLTDATALELTDEWLGIDIGLKLSQPSRIWTFPIEMVSQSEGDFALVHQSVAVIPHWIVQADATGRAVLKMPATRCTFQNRTMVDFGGRNR